MTDRDYRTLQGCDPALIQAMDAVLSRMATLGRPMRVTSGHRTADVQIALYSQGRTTPGRIVTYADGVLKKSNHQSGRACDCVFLVAGRPVWDEDQPWQTYADTAIAQGLQAGYYWTRPDKPHVELPAPDTTGAVPV